MLPSFRKGRASGFNTHAQDSETWRIRAIDAASLWVDHRGASGLDDRPLRIADFGAGNERLREVLAARLLQPFVYFPYDLHPQRRTTKRLNVLKGSPFETFDVVFCLGLLEYLPPCNVFLARLNACCRFAVVSFVYRESSFPASMPEREALGWLAHFDRQALERKFVTQGFSRIAFRHTNDGQTGLWLWEASPASRGRGR